MTKLHLNEPYTNDTLFQELQSMDRQKLQSYYDHYWRQIERGGFLTAEDIPSLVKFIIVRDVVFGYDWFLAARGLQIMGTEVSLHRKDQGQTQRGLNHHYSLPDRTLHWCQMLPKPHKDAVIDILGHADVELDGDAYAGGEFKLKDISGRYDYLQAVSNRADAALKVACQEKDTSLVIQTLPTLESLDQFHGLVNKNAELMAIIFGRVLNRLPDGQMFPAQYEIAMFYMMMLEFWTQSRYQMRAIDFSFDDGFLSMIEHGPKLYEKEFTQTQRDLAQELSACAGELRKLGRKMRGQRLDEESGEFISSFKPEMMEQRTALAKYWSELSRRFGQAGASNWQHPYFMFVQSQRMRLFTVLEEIKRYENPSNRLISHLLLSLDLSGEKS